MVDKFWLARLLAGYCKKWRCEASSCFSTVDRHDAWCTSRRAHLSLNFHLLSQNKSSNSLPWGLSQILFHLSSFVWKERNRLETESEQSQFYFRSTLNFPKCCSEVKCRSYLKLVEGSVTQAVRLLFMRLVGWLAGWFVG